MNTSFLLNLQLCCSALEERLRRTQKVRATSGLTQGSYLLMPMKAIPIKIF